MASLLLQVFGQKSAGKKKYDGTRGKDRRLPKSLQLTVWEPWMSEQIVPIHPVVVEIIQSIPLCFRCSNLGHSGGPYERHCHPLSHSLLNIKSQSPRWPPQLPCFEWPPVQKPKYVLFMINNRENASDLKVGTNTCLVFYSINEWFINYQICCWLVYQYNSSTLCFSHSVPQL